MAEAVLVAPKYSPEVIEKVRYLLSGVLTVLALEDGEDQHMVICDHVDVISKLKEIGPPIKLALKWIEEDSMVKEPNHG